jgi:hypothetical protein
MVLYGYWRLTALAAALLCTVSSVVFIDVYEAYYTAYSRQQAHTIFVRTGETAVPAQ